jgi:2-haloalkanoic acid dehalogenase type II
MPLKAVLFDLGLTLTHTASFPEIYRRILSHFDIEASIDDIICAQKETESKVDTSIYNEKRRKEFWTNYNVSILEKLGIKTNTVFIASKIDTLWWTYSHVQLYPDVESTLCELKNQGLKLGLVSNGFKQDLDHILGKLGLKKWFDAVVCIESCNCSKPDKKIFLYALEKLGIAPDEAVFVGDSIVYDYEGASQAGIKPYLVDRDGRHSDNYDKIKCLTELLNVLKENEADITASS